MEGQEYLLHTKSHPTEERRKKQAGNENKRDKRAIALDLVIMTGNMLTFSQQIYNLIYPNTAFHKEFFKSQSFNLACTLSTLFTLAAATSYIVKNCSSKSYNV